MKGAVKVVIAVGIALAVAYPIRQQLAARQSIQRTMINTLDANDAAALRQWPGSAESFVAMLYDRCMRAHRGDAASCIRYHDASE